MTANFGFVLFDLGGVLVRLSGVDKMQALAGLESEDEVWRRWLGCTWVRRFERGLCSPDEFAAGVVAEWGLSTTPRSFLQQFRGWPEGLFAGAAELVETVRERVPVGCLSNTNELHWADQSTSMGLGALFDATFLSHELGLIKPDADIFDHVAVALNLEPERLLFLDDNEINVISARSVGYTAVRVCGVDEAVAVLAELGVLAHTT